jgi:uncharacterized membrane protein YdbT with pleckstrin-like domain
MNPPEETLVWKGSPSQWTNAGTYLVCLLLVVADIAAYVLLPDRNPWVLTGLALPVLWAMARWLRTRCHVYEVTTERVRETTGVWSRRTTELELYRVRDYTVVEPFWLRMVGRGHLLLETADRTSPHLELHAVPDVTELKDKVRTQTERLRQVRGVRDFEINPQ